MPVDDLIPYWGRAVNNRNGPPVRILQKLGKTPGEPPEMWHDAEMTKKPAKKPWRPPIPPKRKRPGQNVGGATTIFTEELGTLICSRIAMGESLKAICREKDMPSAPTVIHWVMKDPVFREQYRLAREIQAELMGDEILDISDDGTNDWMEKRNKDGEVIGWIENGEALRRSHLRVESRKWVAARLLPKKWGDKVSAEVTGADGQPLIQNTISPRDLTPETREKLKQALLAAINKNDAVDTDYTQEED